MSNFIHNWEKVYHTISKNWYHYSKKEKEEQMNFLEESAQSVLDSWGEMEEKLIALKQKGEIEEAKPLSYTSIGTSYFTLEMFEKAFQTLKNEEEIGEENDLRLLYLGFAAVYSGESNQAIETFLYLIQTKTSIMTRHFAYVGLGCQYAQLDQIDHSIETFQQANKLTSNIDVVYNLGVCHYVNKEYKEASIYFKEAIDSMPDDGEAYFFLGCCQWEMGCQKEAWDCFLSALGLLYSDEALHAFAKISEWHGHHRLAIHCYDRIEALKSRSNQTLHGLAWNYALLDEYDIALRLFAEMEVPCAFNHDVNTSVEWLMNHWPHGKSVQLSILFNR
ncbi:tetratricopeptide repeat protein [Alkalihalophilus sp. As8PL]|uniref:Tetratricopeptide repeat protein n=1 Tax=Alkalihalophilus sp. As8PL TaxID=3237103 RepID=A0AB39BTI9_9BACI